MQASLTRCRTQLDHSLLFIWIDRAPLLLFFYCFCVSKIVGSIYFVLPKSFAKPYRMVARIWTIFFWSHTIGIPKWIFSFKTKRMVWNCVQYRVQREFSILVILVRISLIFSPSTMRNYFLVLDFVSKHEIEKRKVLVPVQHWKKEIPI